MKSTSLLVLKYSLFAAIAILANLGTQEAVVAMYQGRNYLFFSIALGTLVGLVIKYQLDRKFIFAYSTVSSKENQRNFIKYSITGGTTTFLFWACELLGEVIFGTKTARYTGAVIGLTIGYVVKYRLDKRYVFIDRNT